MVSKSEISKYDMTKLCNDMEYLKNKLQKIDICLNGDDSNPESLGLVFLVMENSNFRKKISKFFVATWTAIIALIGKFAYDLVGRQ